MSKQRKYNWESYRPIFEILDRALDKPVVLKFQSKEACTKWRHQCYTARLADRELSKQTNNPGDPGFGVSVYDKLQIVRPEPSVLNIGEGIVDTSFVLESMEGLTGIEDLLDGVELELEEPDEG